MSKIKVIVSKVSLALLFIMLFLFTIFLFQNTSRIDVKFLMFNMQLPIIALIFVATIVGFFSGYLFSIRTRQIQKKQTNSSEWSLEQNELSPDVANKSPSIS